jgi:hypothetical protein
MGRDQTQHSQQRIEAPAQASERVTPFTHVQMQTGDSGVISRGVIGKRGLGGREEFSVRFLDGKGCGYVRSISCTRWECGSSYGTAVFNLSVKAVLRHEEERECFQFVGV